MQRVVMLIGVILFASTIPVSAQTTFNIEVTDEAMLAIAAEAIRANITAQEVVQREMNIRLQLLVSDYSLRQDEEFFLVYRGLSLIRQNQVRQQAGARPKQ